jgi:hypothetical protein
MINWNIFFEDSSIEEAIKEFAYLNSSFSKFNSSCYRKDCKLAIKSLKNKGYKKSRRSAREALSRRGFRIKVKWELVYHD